MAERPTRSTCPNCGRPLVVGDGWERCTLPCQYARATMPTPALGELFGAYGRPWARLSDRTGHGLVHGWRTEVRRG